jgi:hypothetical protein
MKASLVWAGVALVGIVGAIGLGLSLAGWTDQAVAGWMVGIGVFAGTVFGLLAKLESKTDGQTEQLSSIQRTVATVEKQTNGLSEIERQDIADRAADQAVAHVVEALRKEGVIR